MLFIDLGSLLCVSLCMYCSENSNNWYQSLENPGLLCVLPQVHVSLSYFRENFGEPDVKRGDKRICHGGRVKDDDGNFKKIKTMRCGPTSHRQRGHANRLFQRC